MYNQYNDAIDKIEFREDYTEELINTLAGNALNKSNHRFKRTEIGKILIKQKIRKRSFILAILLSVLVCLSTKPVQAAIINLFSYITDNVYHSYETNVSSYKDQIDQSITVDDITMNIYDIVTGKHGMVITYNLVDKKGNAVVSTFPNRTVAFHIMFGIQIIDNQNRMIKGSVEYHEKTSFEDDLSPYLTLVTFEDPYFNTEEWVNCSIKINTKVTWFDETSNPDIKSFSFNYTPTKIYNEKVVNINKKIVIDKETLTVSKLTLNGLYMMVEADYSSDFLDKSFYLKAVDEYGEEIKSYERKTAITEGSDIVEATYMFENIDENVSKIYLIPCYDKLMDNGVVTTIQHEERMEVFIK